MTGRRGDGCRVKIHQPDIIRNSVNTTQAVITIKNVGITHIACLFCLRKDAGSPITKGVGASRSCSDPAMEVGRMGMTGNMYCRGYIRLVRPRTERERAFRSAEWKITFISNIINVRT